MEEFLYSPKFRTLLEVTATFSQGYISGKISELISKFQQDTEEKKHLREKYAQPIGNDHLQRAVRKAQLYATLRVLEKAIKKAPEHETHLPQFGKGLTKKEKRVESSVCAHFQPSKRLYKSSKACR